MEPRIRRLELEDVEKLKEIYNSFYKTEFEFPDFFKNYICTFAITDEKDKIVTAGGVRNIVEAVLLTDKNYSVKDRRQALYQILDACTFLAGRTGFEKLHAVTENETWKDQLLKAGFHSRGSILALDL